MEANMSSQTASVGRRGLLLSLGASAGLFALGWGASKTQAEPLIRPPGGQNRQFLSKCIRCDRCRSVCPTDVIAIGGFSEGVLNLRTPVMNYKYGSCDFCRKCIEVCPTGALTDYVGETVPIGKARLTETCIALRTGACTKCKEQCPYDAISLDERMIPIIDEDKCNGCGVCEHICPANVLQAYTGRKVRGIEIVPLETEETREAP